MRYPKLAALLLGVSLATLGCGGEGEEGAATEDGGAAEQAVQPEAPPAGSPQATAQELLDQVRAQTMEQKWDEAEANLKKLEAMKAQLPEEMRADIEAMRGNLAAAKQIAGQGGSTGQ